MIKYSESTLNIDKGFDKLSLVFRERSVKHFRIGSLQRLRPEQRCFGFERKFTARTNHALPFRRMCSSRERIRDILRPLLEHKTKKKELKKYSFRY